MTRLIKMSGRIPEMLLRHRVAGRIVATAAMLASAAIGFAVLDAASASAATSGPVWAVTSVSRPTNFTPGDETGEESYKVTVTNAGDTASDGSPITITDDLPEGLTLASAGATGEDRLAAIRNQPASAKFSCVLRTCTYSGVVIPGDTLVLTFPVDVLALAPTSVTNLLRVSGGGAPDASMSTPTTISSTAASFDVSPGGAMTALSSTQAGAHPDVTTSIAFNTVLARGALAGDPKSTSDDLPPGFAGDLVDTPACSDAAFLLHECAINTQIGVTTITVDIFGQSTPFTTTEPVYNLSPDPGEAAKIGFHVGPSLAFEGEVSVRPIDYGVRVTFDNADQSRAELDNVSLTIWGVPAAPIHDPLRWNPGPKGSGQFGVSSQAKLAPYFTNSTFCSGEILHAVFTVNSWQDPEKNVTAAMPFGPIVGCDRLGFPSSFTVEPTTERADAPTGLDVTLNVEQTYNNAEGLATSSLKRSIVTLPEGMTVNPSAGAGLGACSLAQYEETTLAAQPGIGCPNDSRLGTVRIKTPVFEEEATGAAYIAQPYANPFKSLLALYVVVRFVNRGVVVKVAGKVTADHTTGRLVATFEGTPGLEGQPSLEGLPPVPFSSFKFDFRQGETSPLVSPPACGSYAATAELNPWSEPSSLLTEIAPSFTIAHGFDGGACPTSGTQPFTPGILAGTLNNRAGSYSSLNLRVTRNDGEQEITRFSAKLPPGLTANLSGVPFCSDASIEFAKSRTGAQEERQPSCSPASQIGHTLVGAGVGSVLAWASGKLYMAGPYNGAPFSIVAITSAKVGPFDLGTVVVREALRIDPNTAVVTVDASASDPIPHIIQGIVVHVRDIRVYVDRALFSLNPTSCERLSFAATVSGAGANFASPSDDVPVTVDDPFQAADCQVLKFNPGFKVSTSGKTSRKSGASLIVKLNYPVAPQGSQANIKAVKVDLPKQLPSRLTTLQKACTDATFNRDPAACPPASRVGNAKARTPILPVPLTGPAYFVSHGGARFPELIVVLQGYGVTVYLHGETFINRAGITSSTFRAVPDQPVTSFELKLPQGSYSALAANGDLCRSNLRMPTAFTAQNGLVIHRSTSIAVTGCKHRTKFARAKTKGARRSQRS